MSKPVEVLASEIRDRDPVTGRVRLESGDEVSGRRIKIIAETVLQPELSDASAQIASPAEHEETVMEAHYREIAEIQAAAAERDQAEHRVTSGA